MISESGTLLAVICSIMTISSNAYHEFLFSVGRLGFAKEPKKVFCIRAGQTLSPYEQLVGNAG